MIVMTRRVGESLVIETASGERIEITIQDAQANRVRIVALASKDVNIFREEELEEPLRYAV